MPSLSQIQNHIKMIKTEIGNINNLTGFKEFAETMLYNESTTDPNDAFIYGADYGDGSDDDHFHICFTSLYMLNRLKEFTNGCFKYYYALFK